MGLYDRDYTQEPTPDEIDEYKVVSKQEVSKDGRRIGRVNMPHLYPEAIRHHQSLFPNYHVDLISTKMNPDFDNINKGFLDLLDNPETHEQLILNYIKSSKAYHIPMSILRAGGFLVGNHGSYLNFPALLFLHFLPSSGPYVSKTSHFQLFFWRIWRYDKCIYLYS